MNRPRYFSDIDSWFYNQPWKYGGSFTNPDRYVAYISFDLIIPPLNKLRACYLPLQFKGMTVRALLEK